MIYEPLNERQPTKEHTDITEERRYWWAFDDLADHWFGREGESWSISKNRYFEMYRFEHKNGNARIEVYDDFGYVRVYTQTDHIIM